MYIFLSLLCIILMEWYALFLVGTDLPYLELLSETGRFFQLSNLDQTVPIGLRNFSNIFVTELVVFASANYSFDLAWNVCYCFTQTGIVLEWLAPCFQNGVAQDEHFCSSSSLVCACCVLGVGETLAYSFSQIMIITGKVI